MKAANTPHSTTTDREDLEILALEMVSAANYYDLVDNIEATTDRELAAIIACKGDEARENALMDAEGEEIDRLVNSYIGKE